MIDYEKLKLAFLYTEKNGIDVNFAYHKDDTWIHWVCMEQFIFDMQEPTKPEPKYKVGDILFWIGYNDDIRENKVESISIRKDIYVYHFSEPDFGAAWEYELFPSHQSLIEHQIAYWQSLQEDKRDVEKMMYDESKKLWPTDIQINQPQVDVDKGQYPTITEKCENYNKSKLEFIDNVNLDQCEHERCPIESYYKRPDMWKCLKCGEFYR